MTTTTETQVGYLTDIKFRNAVKRTLVGFRVMGKNDHRSFAVYIDQVHYQDDTLFAIRYRGGDWAKNGEAQLENQLRLERQLMLAGFELVESEKYDGFRGVKVPVMAWRKRAN